MNESNTFICDTASSIKPRRNNSNYNLEGINPLKMIEHDGDEERQMKKFDTKIDVGRNIPLNIDLGTRTPTNTKQIERSVINRPINRNFTLDVDLGAIRKRNNKATVGNLEVVYSDDKNEHLIQNEEKQDQ